MDQDPEDKGMGSDFENSEDRGGDREDSSDAQDVGKRGGRLEDDMGSNPQGGTPRGASEERELVSDFCAGEDKAAMPVEVAPLTFRSGCSRVLQERELGNFRSCLLGSLGELGALLLHIKAVRAQCCVKQSI